MVIRIRNNRTAEFVLWLYGNIYHLLTEFEVCTVSYGSSYFLLRFMVQARSNAGHKSNGKKLGSVTYSTDREDEVSKIFIISLMCA